MIYSSNNFQNLQNILEQEVNKVSKWLAANKLLLNVSKTHSMLFTFKHNVPNLKIMVNNIEIEEKCTTTFLGVQLDNKLNWKSHISHICKKVSKSIAILRMVRSIFPLNILKMIYMSLIYSHINYCNLIWGGAEDGIIEPLFKLQKKALRIITRSGYLEHTAPLFKSLELLKVNEVYKLNCTLFIYKCLKCNYFPELRNTIQRNSEYHEYNTRGCNSFRNVNVLRLRICQRSFLNNGKNIWNSLIPSIKDSNSFHMIKIAMKRHLLSLN